MSFLIAANYLSKGDERLIRLILFNILWAASRGNEDYAFTSQNLSY